MPNPTETHLVPKLNAPIRLQEYGVGIFQACPTKSALKKTLKKQFVKVNGAVASTATFLIGGETIELFLPEAISPNKKFIFTLQVLFEDEHLALIHKPAGILVSGNSFKTIVNALPQNIKKSTLPDATKPQPVHRLDFPTTGVLLIGKTASAIRVLNKLFENKGIEKTYYAVTIGEMKANGKINLAIDDKPTISEYNLVQSVASERFGILNLVKLYPKTGRRHQLRKHMASIGNPILGDKDYGKKDLVLQGKGLYLHAHSLQFTHPFTNKEIHIKDGLPKRFKKIFPLI